MPTMTPMAQPPAIIEYGTTGPPSSGSGRNGSAVRRACQTNVSASVAERPIIARMSGEPHGMRLPPQVSTSTTTTAAAISSTPPSQSTLRGR